MQRTLRDGRPPYILINHHGSSHNALVTAAVSPSLPSCACATMAHSPPKLIGGDVLTQALTCCGSASAETAGWQL